MDASGEAPPAGGCPYRFTAAREARYHGRAAREHAEKQELHDALAAMALSGAPPADVRAAQAVAFSALKLERDAAELAILRQELAAAEEMKEAARLARRAARDAAGNDAAAAAAAESAVDRQYGKHPGSVVAGLRSRIRRLEEKQEGRSAAIRTAARAHGR